MDSKDTRNKRKSGSEQEKRTNRGKKGRGSSVLTPRQELFCMEYAKDRNGTQACIRAGFNPNTAASMSSKMLSKDNIQAKIKILTQTVAESLGIDIAYVLNNFKKVAARSMQEEPVLDRDGNPIGEYVFDSSGANKATEMLGKHLGAFEKDNSQQRTELKVNIIKLADGTVLTI